MAKGKTTEKAKLNTAAEQAGRTLGRIARSIDGVRERHPRPADEAREAIAAGKKRIAKAAHAVAKKTRKVVKIAKAAATRSQKAVKRVQKTVARRVAKR